MMQKFGFEKSNDTIGYQNAEDQKERDPKASNLRQSPLTFHP